MSGKKPHTQANKQVYKREKIDFLSAVKMPNSMSWHE